MGRQARLDCQAEVGSGLITRGTIDDLLRSAASEARKLTKASGCTILLLDESTGELVVREMVGSLPEAEFVGTRFAPASTKAHGVLNRRTAEVVDELAADPETHPESIRRLGNPRSGAFVPLVVDSRGLGTLAVYDRIDGRPFTRNDLSILQILANQAALALENDRLTEALRDLAVLEERERIAKELHDGVIQSIYSVGLALRASTSLLRRDPGLADERINQAIAELDNVVRDVRSYIFELRPQLLDEKGLVWAITELIKDLEVNTLARTSIELDSDTCNALDEEQQRHVVQIVRELLSNIARHGQASEVSIACFTSTDGAVVIEIGDDGVGFDPNNVKRGQGLTNIEQRAEKLGGIVTMSARKPRGMRFTVQIASDEA